MASRSIWYRIRQFVFYAVLLPLPVTLIPTITGLISGALFAYWNYARVPINTEALVFEMQSDAQMSYFNVPGAPSIFDVNTGPFYDATKLRTADWYDKLGFWKDRSRDNMDTGVDEKARFDGLGWPGSSTHAAPRVTRQHLYPDRAEPKPTTLMSAWVYVTYLPMPDYDPWDRAFVQLLQYHAATPPPDDAQFFHVDCLKSGFLCGIWAVKRPSLLQFSVEEDAPLVGYRKKAVKVKVVNLPLDNWTPAPGAFPTEFEQMRAVTSGNYSLVDTGEWFELDQVLERFYDYLDDLLLYYKNTLGRLFKWKEWLQGHYSLFEDEEQPLLSIVVQLVEVSVFAGTALLGTGALFIFEQLKSLSSWFVGTPGSPGTPNPWAEEIAVEELQQQAREQGGGPGMRLKPGENMMGDMLHGFFAQHADEISQAAKGLPDDFLENMGQDLDPMLRNTLRDLFQAAKAAAPPDKDGQ